MQPCHTQSSKCSHIQLWPCLCSRKYTQKCTSLKHQEGGAFCLYRKSVATWHGDDRNWVWGVWILCSYIVVSWLAWLVMATESFTELLLLLSSTKLLLLSSATSLQTRGRWLRSGINSCNHPLPHPCLHTITQQPKMIFSALLFET